MPSSSEGRRRRKTIVKSRGDDEVAKARTELDAFRMTPTDWWYAVKYADALFAARRFKEALQAYEQALSMCPGECGTSTIEEGCRKRIAECRRRKSVR